MVLVSGAGCCLKLAAVVKRAAQLGALVPTLPVCKLGCVEVVLRLAILQDLQLVQERLLHFSGLPIHRHTSSIVWGGFAFSSIVKMKVNQIRQNCFPQTGDNIDIAREMALL